MPRILLVAVLFAAAIYWVPALVGAFKRLDPTQRRRLARASLALVGVVLVVLILARFGLQWFGVVGGAAWAIVRTLVPWALRLLPLSRRFRERWGRGGSAPHEGSDRGGESALGATGMSRAEALETLGVVEGTSKEDIVQAYRNLIRKVHPDTPGGSAYLASKLNQAKDVLLS